MSLHVLFTVNRCAKALLAERTLVRLQAHVCGHVPCEAAIGGEGGTADAAAEGLDSCTNRQSRQGTCHFIIPESWAFRTNKLHEEFILLTVQGFDWIPSET